MPKSEVPRFIVIKLVSDLDRVTAMFEGNHRRHGQNPHAVSTVRGVQGLELRVLLRV